MSTGSRSKDRDRELSEIIQEAQLLRADVLQRAQREAKQYAEPLWRLLLREGLLSDDQLFRVLKQYLRVPVLAEEHLDNVVVPPELREAITPRLAQELGVLPLERSTDGRRAALAMIDPTLSLSPLWPELSKLGVAEVRRFLLNLPTLRRGMQMFYGQAWQPDADAALDGPTPPPSRSAVTQPIPRSPSEGPTVMVDPELQAEIAQLSGSMLVPDLSGETAIPSEQPTPPPKPNRAPMPLSHLATVPPSGQSAPRGEAAATSQSSGRMPASPVPQAPRPAGEPVAAAPAPSGPSASAIAIEIDLADLSPAAPAAPAASSRATPLHELSGPRAPTSGRVASGPLPAPSEASRPSSSSARSGQGLVAPAAAPPSTASGPVASRAPSAQSGPGTAGQPLPRITPTTAGVRPLPRPNLAPPLPATTFRRPPAPSAPIVLPEPSAHSAQSPLPELSAEVVVDEDRSGLTLNRSALRVPTAAAESGSEVAPDVVQDGLMAACESLVATLEANLQTSWPTALARLCQSVGDRLGFAPRAVRELMLMARLRGVQRAELQQRGPLPPAQPTLLGYPASSPLLGAAQSLQKVLVDFMHLPQDENEPLGVRIIRTAALALELHGSGLGDEELLARLREQAGDTDVVFHAHKALALDPPQLDAVIAASLAPSHEASSPSLQTANAPSNVPSPAAAFRPARAPLLCPLPPRMPAVPWRTVWTTPPMSGNELSDEDLSPYSPAEL